MSKFKQTEIGLIPEDWENIVLFDLVNIISGGTPKTSNLVYWNGNIPWISIIDFTSSKYIRKTEKTITEKGLLESSTNLLKEGQLIISARGTVGLVKVIKGEMAFNQSCYGIDSKNQNELNNDFLYYILVYKINDIQSKTHGSVFQTITRNTFNQIIIPLPPIQEQKAIAKVLSDLDSKIEVLQKQNETLEEIGKTLFKRWFVDFEFPNDEGEPYKSSGGEMVDSELGLIPEGWEIGNYNDGSISKILKSGIKKFKNEKIYLDTASVQNTKIINRSSIITYDSKPSRANMQPIQNTVWFAKMKDSRKILFFDNYSIDEIENYILSTGFLGLQTKEYSLYYILLNILEDKFDEKKNMLCVGTTMQAINNDRFESIKLLIPKKEILLEFNKQIKPFFYKFYINSREIILLEKTRDALLPKLMSGEIRVKIDET